MIDWQAVDVVADRVTQTPSALKQRRALIAADAETVSMATGESASVLCRWLLVYRLVEIVQQLTLKQYWPTLTYRTGMIDYYEVFGNGLYTYGNLADPRSTFAHLLI